MAHLLKIQFQTKYEIISWNTRGLNDKSKQSVLKHLLQNQHPYLVMIQEIKRSLIDIQFIKSIWSSNDIG